MASAAYTTPPSAADARSRAERYLTRHLDRASEMIALLDATDGDPDLEAEPDQKHEIPDGPDWPEVIDQRLIWPVDPDGIAVRQIVRRLAEAR